MWVQNLMIGVIFACCIAVCIYDVEINPVSKVVYPARRDRYRRLSKWLPLGLTYALFYTCRYNVIAGNVPHVREYLGFTSTQFGLVFTAGFWTYGATAPFTGYLTDKLGAKKSLVIATLGCAVSNIALGIYFEVSDKFSLWAFLFFYSSNIFFQGFGTAGIVKVNGSLYSAEERGVFSGLFNVLITSGYFIALAICPQLVSNIGWSSVFFIPGSGLIVCVILMYFTLPNDIGLGIVEPEAHEKGSMDLENQMLTESILEEQRAAPKKRKNPVVVLLRSRIFVLYLVAIMCTSWTRDSLLTWVFSFLASGSDEGSLDEVYTTLIATGVTFGGFVGGIGCGKISDFCFGGKRVQPMLFFNACLFLTIIVFYLIRDTSAALISFCIFIICVFLLGNYTILSYTIPADLPPELVGTAAGIMTAAGYLASGTSGVVLGGMIQAYGYLWGWLSLMLASTFICMMVISAAYFYQDKAIGTTSDKDFELKRMNLKPHRDSALISSRNGDFFPLLASSSGPDTEYSIRSYYHPPTAIRSAGIADEMLRSRFGSNVFFQFSPLDTNDDTIADRIAWRLDIQKPDACKANQVTESEDTQAFSAKENESIRSKDFGKSKQQELTTATFLASRYNDPTSYFGTRKTNNHALMPW